MIEFPTVEDSLQLAAGFFNCSRDEITAFHNVNLVPMTEEGIVKNQTILIKGKKIIAIGSSNKVEIPENSKRIDGSGAYLMSGLADMHMYTRDD